MLKGPDIRQNVERFVADEVVPLATRYDYDTASVVPLGSWKPVVLIIGNYSSGKSTLINELTGVPAQRTGQAPTDDCFTVLVGADEPGEGVVEEVPGQTVVNDPSMPFGAFKQFGSRFISHFQLKKVASPALRNLAIIDSPGMLDSVTELDRGYDYQRVIGRLAELADLVVLVFDPHRAGTIKETYVSIRSTLPEATSEDRVLFVMNRIDECKNLSDLLRCYGVLCWNLSQMTGRKDIPRIFLTYSPTLASSDNPFTELAGERRELVAKIEQAPRLQINHILGSVDNHLHRLELIARAMAAATEDFRRGFFGYLQIAIVASVGGAIAVDAVIALASGRFSRSSIGRLFSGELWDWPLLLPIVLLVVGAVGFYQYYRRRWRPARVENLLGRLKELAGLETRYEHDLWDAVGGHVAELVKDPRQLGPLAPHRYNAGRLRRLLSGKLRDLYEQHLGTAPPERPGA